MFLVGIIFNFDATNRSTWVRTTPIVPDQQHQQQQQWIDQQQHQEHQQQSNGTEEFNQQRQLRQQQWNTVRERERSIAGLSVRQFE